MGNTDSENTHYDSGVKGWLLIFCLSLVFFIPVSALIAIAISYKEKSDLFAEIPGVKTVTNIDVFFTVVLVLLGIRAGILLWTVKNNAVKAAKAYLLISLGYSLVSVGLPFLIALPSEVREALAKEFIIGFFSSLPYVAIWYSYLKISTRVKATYGTH